MTKDFRHLPLKLYERVYASQKTVILLRVIDRVSVIISMAVFALMIYWALCCGVVDALKLVAMAAIPFTIVSAFRMTLKSERPYEIIDFSRFSTEPPHRKRGSSFPSRHVFSAFLIAFLAFEYSCYLGILGVILGVILAISRVALGIHFTKDVVCGAIVGIVSGIIGMLIL